MRSGDLEECFPGVDREGAQGTGGWRGSRVHHPVWVAVCPQGQVFRVMGVVCDWEASRSHVSYLSSSLGPEYHC